MRPRRDRDRRGSRSGARDHRRAGRARVRSPGEPRAPRGSPSPRPARGAARTLRAGGRDGLERSADGTGASACTPCPHGTHSAEGATSCAPWTDCEPGEYVTAAGSATSDRACAACPAGGYSTETNAASCAPWTECAADQYASAEGTTIRDRACAPRTACEAGSVEVSACTATADTVCMRIGAAARTARWIRPPTRAAGASSPERAPIAAPAGSR